MEAAVHAQVRAHGVAITVDQKRQQLAQEDPVRHRSTSASAILPAVRRIRMSRLPSRACCPRNNSRNTRFIRLRSTARGKTRFGTMRPSLGTPNVLALESTLNPGRLSARPPAPPASNAAMSAVPSRDLRPYRLRTLKRLDGLAPWHDGRESRLGPRGCAYGQETHESVFCERQRGERYVSSEHSLIADRTFH